MGSAFTFKGENKMRQHEYIYPDSFEFEAGGSITGLKLVYHTSPEPWLPGDRRKVVWICHALTANSDVEDWWSALVGEGKLIDTQKYFVVCVNMLGSAYGSHGPATVNPETGKPLYFDFPPATVRDIVRSNILVRKHLRIPKIDFLLGASIGGFQAVEWAIMEPEIIRKAVFMACSPRVTPWITAWEESQRMALEADASFRACGSLSGGRAGLECARSIGMISYRSYEGYNLTQSEADDDTLFAGRSASYQRYQGKKLADRFDAYSYYYLSLAVDSHNVGRGRGGVAKALSGIKADTTVIGIDSDRILPVNEQHILADNIPGARYFELTSAFGHDGFLLESEQITAIIAPILEEL